MKKALITGISGQDGAYLSDLLLNKNYEVHGLERRTASNQQHRLRYFDILDKIKLHKVDLCEFNQVSKIIIQEQYDEIYNLGAQSHVAVSFTTPVSSSQTSTLGLLSLLEPIRKLDKEVKFYQASSSEMYGGATQEKLNEESLFDPKSPYAAGKLFAHNMNKIYRESYDMFCVNGILFNHESPHRGETFVTRKISRAVGRIKLGLQSKLTLGNLEAKRDLGFAGDYVEGMWKMMSYEKADDWVLATGEAYKVSDFAKASFNYVGLNWEDYVVTSKRYERPNEVHHLLGDSSKAQKLLGWKPVVDFNKLVELMVESDFDLATQEKTLIDNNLIKPTWEHPC